MAAGDKADMRAGLVAPFLPGPRQLLSIRSALIRIRPQARELLKAAHSADADVFNFHIIL